MRTAIEQSCNPDRHNVAHRGSERLEAMSTPTIRASYSMWPQYNRRLRDVVATMTDEQLAIRPAPDLLPIWATVGHTAAMRVYWLCEVVGEPGGEGTPLWDGAAIDWADDLDHPRGPDELVTGLDSSFRIIEGCLDRWTPAMLEDTVERRYGGTAQLHTRSSILQRLLT